MIRKCDEVLEQRVEDGQRRKSRTYDVVAEYIASKLTELNLSTYPWSSQEEVGTPQAREK